MRKTKQFAALGLSTVMMMSMVAGVSAATDDQLVNGRGEGKTEVSADADVDVDGYLTKDAIIDTDGSLIDPSLPSYSTQSSSVFVPTVTTDSAGSTVSTLLPTYTEGNTPVDPSGSHVSWGDDSTANSTQVIITAPTKLSFQVAGEGDAANIQLSSEGKNITGTILNQSCYIDEDLMVVPKDVEVSATRTATGTEAFALVADNANFAENSTAVKGVFLGLGEGTGATYTDFATMTTSKVLGTLPKGTKALTVAAGDGKKAQAVNPSSTKIYFSDKTGGATGVSTQFAEDYDGSNLKTNYNVNMVYKVK